MSGKLKIRELATQSGLSISTVSRVLAGKANASASSRARVLACARENGVLADLGSPPILFNRITVFAPKRAFDLRADVYYYRVIQGIRTAVARSDIRVAYCAIEENAADVPLFLARLGHPECDAGILIGIDDPHIHELAASFGKPCVLINCDSDSMRLDAVSPDHHIIGRCSARFLVEYGHRDILVLMCLRRMTMERRLDGIREILSEAGIAFDDDRHLVTTTGFGAEEAREALAAYLITHGNEALPTVILAGGDFMAAGAIDALHAAGLSTPGAVSVMSMDSANLATTHDLQLTSMHVPRDELGGEALRLLQRRIGTPDSPFCRLLLGGRLVTGNSVKRIGGRKQENIARKRQHALYGDLSLPS